MKEKAKSSSNELNNSLILYGYNKYFKLFEDLYKTNRLPNTILFNGPKGIGKSTFANHFINYLLSSDEQPAYDSKNYEIDSKNPSYNLCKNNIHPNFFLLNKNNFNNDIKIDQVRHLLKFLNKTTYKKDLKIVLIDNTENLNLSSSNALLKALEEASQNTFFFIIHDESNKLIETIKSRSVIFNFHLSFEEKKNIFMKLISNYDFKLDQINLDKFLYFDTPGNIFKYYIELDATNLNSGQNNLSLILYLVEKYKSQKSTDLLSFIKVFIENFYHDLCLKNSFNISNYYLNKNRILYLLEDMKKFNLDKKNSLFTVSNILKNEK